MRYDWKKEFAQKVLRERPDLRGKPIVAPSDFKVHVLMIGRELFKSAYADQEVKTLQQLEGSGLSVPKVTCIGQHSRFFGMTRVPGVPLWPVPRKLEHSASKTEQLGKEIADFIIDLAKILPQKEGRFATHDDLNRSNVRINPKTLTLGGIIDFERMVYLDKEDLPYVRFSLSVPKLSDAINKAFAQRKSELKKERRYWGFKIGKTP